MSRIAGCVSPASPERKVALLEVMVQGVSWPAAWGHRAVSCGGAAFAGIGPADVAVSDGLLVALDGRVLNAGGSGVEAVASLHRRFGFEEALRRLEGDFAVALYDAAAGALWLGRDRFGVRPLYYAVTPEGVAFGSRPGLLLRFPGVGRKPLRRFMALFGACHYRAIDNDPEASPYEGIRQVPAASCLLLQDGKASLRRYWSPEDAPDWDLPEDELADRYRELLRESVVRRLQAAKRPAFLLSGGMDSSSVLALAHRATGAKPTAFSVVYDDGAYDESSDIREILDEHVAEWHPVRVGTPDVFDIIHRMVRAHDEPVATATWLSHLLLCAEAAAGGWTSLFGGLGGDELNAGEYEYFPFHFADLRAAGREADLQREIDAWVRHHDHPVFRKTPAVAGEAMRRLVDPVVPGRCLPDRARLFRYARLLHPDFFRLEDFEPVMEHPFRSCLKNRTWQDLSRETMPCCLRAEDRNTSGFGLDHCEPFLDARVVEFMYRVPGTLKIRDGVTKQLLRRAMKGTLCEATRTRIRKTGWNAPAHRWFSGPGKGAVLDLVGSRAFRERGIFDVARVAELAEEHDRIVSSGQPRENHMMVLWQIVNLELWLRDLEGFRV